MSRRQLAALLLCNLGIYVMGNMVFGLLPVYAVRLGMDESTIGLFLGLAFSAITIGALSSGWFSDRFQRRKLTMILACIPGIPAAYLMGQVNSFAPLLVCTLIVWFVSGLAGAMVNILTGLHAGAEERGRVFGLLATSSLLGIALGNFAAGAIVDRWGYPTLYALAALVWLLPIIAGLFITDDVRTGAPVGQPKASVAPLTTAVWLLLLASVSMNITNFSASLVRPLIMDGMSFDASAISSAAAISALVTLPLPFLVGWLSDRIGRKSLLIAGYALASVGMLALMFASSLWHFWASASLFSLAGATTGVASAYVTDLVPPEALSKALSRFSATAWIGAIIGYVVTGMIIEPLGLTNTVIIGAALSLLAIVMLLGIRQRVQLAPA